MNTNDFPNILCISNGGGGGGGGSADVVAYNRTVETVSIVTDIPGFDYDTAVDITTWLPGYDSTVIATILAAYNAGKSIRYTFDVDFNRYNGLSYNLYFGFNDYVNGTYTDTYWEGGYTGNSTQQQCYFSLTLNNSSVRDIATATHICGDTNSSSISFTSYASVLTSAGVTNFDGKFYMWFIDNAGAYAFADYLKINSLTITILG